MLQRLTYRTQKRRRHAADLRRFLRYGQEAPTPERSPGTFTVNPGLSDATLRVRFWLYRRGQLPQLPPALLADRAARSIRSAVTVSRHPRVGNWDRARRRAQGRADRTQGSCRPSRGGHPRWRRAYALPAAPIPADAPAPRRPGRWVAGRAVRRRRLPVRPDTLDRHRQR